MGKPATAIETSHDKFELVRRVEQEILGGDSYSTEGLISRMQRDVLHIADNFIDIGRCALAIKEVAGHGEFLKLITEHLVEPGIMSERNIRNAMKVASFALTHGGTVKFLSDLPRAKQLMLAGAPEDEIDDEAGTIFGMSEADIKGAKIADLRALVDKLSDKIDQRDKAIARGKEQLLEAREEASKYRYRYRFVQGEEERAFNAKLDRMAQSLQADLLLLSGWDPSKGSPSENASWLSTYVKLATMLETEHAEALRRARQAGVAA